MTPLPGTQPAKPVAKALPNQASKKTQPSTQSSSPGLNPPQTDQQQQQQALKCPRCDSSNTKFCYYNNYSLAQPRHFCKTCRRYWTKGGALRNVPVGGGSHKNKRLKPSYSSSSKDFPGDIGGLKLFHGESAALDFQLGGFEIPRGNPPNPLNVGIYESQFPALGEGNPSSIIGGMNFPVPMVIHSLQPPAPSSSGSLRSLCDPSSMKIDGNLASSIESLSCINQDLHWKLQQQRLAAIYADSIPRDNRAASSNHEPFGGSAPGSHQENIANGSNSAPPATEWFFGNSASYSSVTPSPTDSGSNGNENTSCNNWHRNSNSNNNNGNVGALIHHHQGWGARNVQQQYRSLP